jgi:hypothetical protein
MTNVLESAKSGRASCRLCKQKIDKGEVRLGIESIFVKDGTEYKSFKWHHFQCAVDKRPDDLLTATRNVTLNTEQEKIMKDLMDKGKRTATSIIPISELKEPGKRVNVRATVKKAFKKKKMFDNDGNERVGRSLYITYEDINSKINLWDEHADIELNPSDTIVIMFANTFLGSNNNIQIEALSDSKVLINPTDDDLGEIESVEVFVTSSWEHPQGEFSRFEYAKSSRAKCRVCEEKIGKGELKLVKPVWGKDEEKDRTFPSLQSFHTFCGLDDDHGPDFVREAITRLTTDIITESRENLVELYETLPEIGAKSDLKKLLNI